MIVERSDVLQKISPLSEALYALIVAKLFVNSFGKLTQRVPQSELRKQIMHLWYKWREKTK